MIGLCIAAAAAEIVVGDNLGGFRDRPGSKVGLCVSLLSAFNPTHWNPTLQRTISTGDFCKYCFASRVYRISSRLFGRFLGL
jgi:hypothetical protein